MDSLLLALTGGVLFLTILAICISHWGPRGPLLTVTLVTFLLPQTQLPLPADPRAMGLLCIAILFVYSLLSQEGHRPHIPLAALLPFGFLLLSLAWTTGTKADSVAQAAFVGALLIVASVRFTPTEILWAIRVALAILLLATFVTLATSPGAIWLGGRLRGPMISANSLALLCTFAFPAFSGLGRLAPFVAGPLTLITVWYTGSRAALLALLVQFILMAFGRLRTGGRLVAGVAFILAAWNLLPSIMRTAATQGAGSESVLRSNNSRESVWQDSLLRIQDAPWVGTGLGSLTSDFETGSSLLSIALLGGYSALILTAACLAILLRQGVRNIGLGDWRLILLIGTLTNAIFEGWLVAAGTGYCLLFWIVAAHVGRSGFEPFSKRDIKEGGKVSAYKSLTSSEERPACGS